MILGIYVFFLCFGFVSRRHVFEAIPLLVIGIFLFRGGIHLLKVAVAAEVCFEARSAQSERSPRPVTSRQVKRQAASSLPHRPRSNNPA
jgi:hypothetical protein